MNVVDRTETMSRITHGRLRANSPSSARTLVVWARGGVTRSAVVANVVQNIITDSTAKMAIVSWKPRISLPSPRNFTSGRTNVETSNAPPYAPTNRKLEATVRV